jgi:hypothetical protein
LNEPVRIHSFADFQRSFGGLWSQSELGYAVQQYFLNGGADAYVVRAITQLSITTFNTTPPFIQLGPPGSLRIAPNNPGTWFTNSNAVAITVDNNTRLVNGAKVPGEFNLTFSLTETDPVTGAQAVTTEAFRNVSMAAGATNNISTVLQNDSNFIVAMTPLPAAPPPPSPPGNPYVYTGVAGDDGSPLSQNDLTAQALLANKQGMYALENAEIFTLLVFPPYSPNEAATPDLPTGIWSDALAYLRNQNHRAMLLIDPPSTWIDKNKALGGLNGGVIDSYRDKNSVMYFPWVDFADPLLLGRPRTFAPSAAIAGVMARIDSTRGVWKAPAGQEANVTGVQALVYNVTDLENGDLNPLALNCLRTFPIIGTVVWGARTLDGADAQASEWKYLPVRRTALFIEESLYRGTQWVVFEPNDEPLWSQIRLNVGAFMRSLFRQGAFQGTTPQQAYFVKCDSDTTTQTDIDNGIVNILVGFAPLKPAEFVVIKISQIAGNIQT